MLTLPGCCRYFSEHIAAAEGSWRRALQDCVAPWWRLVSDGCNCNRDTLAAIKRIGTTGSPVRIRGRKKWRVSYRTVNAGLVDFSLGIATKPKPKPPYYKVEDE